MSLMRDAHATYWARPAPELLGELGSSARGLTAAEAAARLLVSGKPIATQDGAPPAARLLLRQVQNPLVLILVFGAAISLVVREWLDAAIILAIVFGSLVLGFLQEYRASIAVAELRKRLALTVRVIRDGIEATVPAATIVPGDVVRLSAGNLVPGDGIVLEARDFLVSEASLTGESFPVEKQPGVVPAATPLAKRSNAVFLGTSVRSGTATILVAQTGAATAMGAIAARLEAAESETEFARGIRQFGYLLVRVMLVMVVFVLVVNQLLGRPLLDSLLFAMALAVGMSPELLPAVVSVTLARGARAMAKEGVIVARLEAIENLGSIDVLCTDKTGTLTEGIVALNQAVDADGHPATSVMEYAWLNASLETGIENPLDAAIVGAGSAAGASLQDYRKIDEIPYDFIRKRLTIVVARGSDTDDHLIITKGAFSNVLAICSTLRRGDSDLPLDDAMRAALEEYFRAQGDLGCRVLALATRRIAPRPRYTHDDEADMTFCGFLLFQDPPKATAHRTIADLAALGIRIKIITGDNRHVAAHVAAGIGLESKAMLTGEQISQLVDEALWQQAEVTDLFVEVDPQQKERIVRALQAMGHAVGYLGDGVNDAPALRAADVGISVDKAVDVARASADVILLEPDLDVLRKGVEDGRRTFANTLKYIGITTSANFGNMVSMALATPLLPFLPLAAKQILFNNFLSDLPSVFISTDNVDAARIRKAQRWRIADVRRFMLVFGLLSTVFNLATFGLLLRVFHASETVFQTTWFVVSLLTELAVVLVLRTEGPMHRSRPSPMLWWSTLVVAVVALTLPYIGPIAVPLGFVPLPLPIAAAGLAVVAAYIASTELAKRRFYREPAA